MPSTGKRVWHYQFVRHDIWDRDLPQAPVLVTVTRGGRRVDAVAQVTKTGHVFVFNRETGEPLFPIEELAAPASDLEGEQAWPIAALAGEAGAVLAAAADRSRPHDHFPGGHSKRARALPLGAQRSSVHAAERAGHDRVPGIRWRGRMGRLRLRPCDGPAVRERQQDGLDPPHGRDCRAQHGEAGALGRRTYEVYCGTCHGENRQGEAARGYPPLEGLESRMSRAEVSNIVGERSRR